MVLINNYKRIKSGFLVLTIVLLVGATILAISTGILMRSISKVNQIADFESSSKASMIVNSCAEYALGQMATTSTTTVGWSYSGGESLSIDSEMCYIYPVEDGDLGIKIIKASSTVSAFT